MNLPDTQPGPRYGALLQLLRTAEALWESSRVFFARWNLSPSQFNLLNLLPAPPQGLSQIELSRALITHRSNVTGLVDRLEKRGLVARRADTSDRRAHRVVLTPAGEQLRAQILPHFHTKAEQVWGGLSPERANQLAAALGQVAGNANAIAELTAQPVPPQVARLKPGGHVGRRRKGKRAGAETSAASEPAEPIPEATSAPPAETDETDELPVSLL